METFELMASIFEKSHGYLKRSLLGSIRSLIGTNLNKITLLDYIEG